MGPDSAALGDEHVSKEENQVQRNTQIPSDEVLIVERDAVVVNKDVKVLGEQDEAAEEERNVGSDEALGSDVGHDAVGDVLLATRFEEVDVCDEEGDP